MLNPLGLGFDALVAPRPANGGAGVSPAPSEGPTDSVSSGSPSTLDPYEALARMRKQGMGSTSLSQYAAQQLNLGGSTPPTQPSPAPTPAPVEPSPAAVASSPPAPTQPSRAPVASPPPVPVESPVVAEQPPAKPFVPREPVSDDMRQMVEDMRRNGVIPEPPSPPAPVNSPTPSAVAAPTPPPQAPSNSPAPPPPPEAAPVDPWVAMEKMQKAGQGAAPISGFAVSQLGLDAQPPAEPPAGPVAQGTPAPVQPPASPAEQPANQPFVPSNPEHRGPTGTPQPLPAQEPAPAPTSPPAQGEPIASSGTEPSPARPLKEPVTGDMAQMLDDMRAAGALPGEDAPTSAPPAPASPAPTGATAPETPPADAWAQMDEMRQKGLGSTGIGSFARQQIDLDQFDQQHPKQPPTPPPADFEIAPSPRPEPVIQPGGENRVFDDFQIPPPPQPDPNWFGKWGDFQPGTQPGQPQQSAPHQTPGPQPAPPRTSPQAPQQGAPQPPPAPGGPPSPPPPPNDPNGNTQGSGDWWGSWGDFGPGSGAQVNPGAAQPASPNQPFTPGTTASQAAPTDREWWGKWGEFTANSGMAQNYANMVDGLQQSQYRPHTGFYDPRSQMDPRYFDPRSQGFYQAQPVQFPYQPHPGNLPPQMGGGIDPMMLMQMPSPGAMMSPMFSPMMSMLPMISMMPMMSMMMMPLMTLPFMFGGFGF